MAFIFSFISFVKKKKILITVPDNFGLQTYFLTDVFTMLGVNYESVRCDIFFILVLGSVFETFLK